MLLFLATLGLPVLLGLVSFVFFREKVTNKELLGLFGVSIVSFLIMNIAMKSYNVDDTRYVSDLVNKTTYYEPWNEYIHRTCSRTHCTGAGKTRSCYTTYYDCSYVKNHSEYWTKSTNTNRELEISESEYSKIVKLWGGKRYFVDMNRNYHTKDGDAYSSDWDKKITTVEIATFTQQYENRTLTANTLFNHEPYSKEQAVMKGLYEYPDLGSNHQLTILGHPALPSETKRYYDYLNTFSDRYRVYVLYFKNKPVNTAFEQKKHWQGGNDNELVICVGLDAKNTVKWVEPFSWSKSPIVEAKIRTYFSHDLGFDLAKLYPQLSQWMRKDWKKRDFHDFDYIEVELTRNQVLWIWILLSVINIGFTIFIIKNEFTR